MNPYEQHQGDAVSPANGVPHMTKKLLTATFKQSDKPVTRTTDIPYTHAWLAFGHDSKGVKNTWTGFSKSRALAERAANAGLGRFTHNPIGREVVEVVATEPAKKVNPAKGKPWRIVSTTPGYSGARFVLGDRGEHLRFVTEAEARIKADELARESDARHAKNSNILMCVYRPHKGPLKS